MSFMAYRRMSFSGVAMEPRKKDRPMVKSSTVGSVPQEKTMGCADSTRVNRPGSPSTWRRASGRANSAPRHMTTSWKASV